MRKPTKIVLIILASLLIIVIFVGLFADSIIKSKIEKHLATSLPENLKVEYHELDVSTFNGHLQIKGPKITNYGNTTKKIIWQVEADELVIDGVSLWNYLVNSEIDIENFELGPSKISYHYNNLVDTEKHQFSNLETLKEKLSIHNFKIKKADISISEFATDSLLMKIDQVSFGVTNLILDESTIKKHIPVSFESYHLSSGAFFCRMNEFEDLTLKSSDITSEKTKFNGLKMATRYSRNELSKIIKKERDHFDISIDSIVISQQEIGFVHDTLFYFNSPKLDVYQPELEMYRDKLVADDYDEKDLYSKMLRDLKFNLSLDNLNLHNGKITYSERVKVDNLGGKLEFSGLNSNMKHIGNTYPSSQKAQIAIKATFMESTPLSVNWEFDVHNENDDFVFKADVGRLQVKDMNRFSEPNLRVRLEGELLKTYFTVFGNNENSSINIKLNYNDFKVTILNKDGKHKNRLLSTIANLLIVNNSDKAENNFKTGSKQNVLRKKNKSIFNFIWLNLAAGIKDAMTGKAKT